MNTSSRNIVERFSKSLALGLYDKQIELANIPVLFYYDADVIYKLVLGFKHMFPRIERDTKALLVRALLSCGYLGKFYMVRPHAFEFYEKLRRQRQYRTESDQRSFYNQVRTYIEDSGIKEDMHRLHDIIAETPHSQEEKNHIIEQFLSILQKKSGEAFARIEQINGTWDQRLRRYYDNSLLNLERLGLEISDLILDHPTTLNTINAIVRKKRRPEYSINSFQDAAAITILNKFIVDRDQGNTTAVCRFYTETVDILELVITDSVIHDLLIYKNPIMQGVKIPHDGNFICRDSDYFIIRIMFKELFPNTTTSRPEELKNLGSLSEKLEDLLKTNEKYNDLEKALEKVEVNGKTLSEIIKIFEEFSIMEPLWVKGQLPAHLEKFEMLAKWTEIFQFAQERRIGVILHERIKDIRQKLESQVKKIRVWTNDYKSIISARVEKAGQYKNGIVDPVRDLGLVRWNYDLNQKELDEIKKYIEDLTGSDDSDFYDAAQDLAMELDYARSNSKRCLVVCAILWALGCFQKITELVDECEWNISKKIPPTLAVLRLAAKLKSGVEYSQSDRRSIVDEAIEMIETGSNRQGILLGVGYVLYHAWKQEMISKSVKERLFENKSELIRYWAQKSFEVGEDASGSLPKNSLPWAYAVNHCTYVGTITGVYPEKTNEYLEILFGLKTLPAIWSPRFDDTIGCHYLIRAEKLWFSSEDKHKVDIRDDLKSAKRYLDEASRKDPGDIDILEHLGRLDNLTNAYRKEKSSHSLRI